MLGARWLGTEPKPRRGEQLVDYLESVVAEDERSDELLRLTVEAERLRKEWKAAESAKTWSLVAGNNAPAEQKADFGGKEAGAKAAYDAAQEQVDEFRSKGKLQPREDMVLTWEFAKGESVTWQVGSIDTSELDAQRDVDDYALIELKRADDDLGDVELVLSSEPGSMVLHDQTDADAQAPPDFQQRDTTLLRAPAGAVGPTGSNENTINAYTSTRELFLRVHRDVGRYRDGNALTRTVTGGEISYDNDHPVPPNPWRTSRLGERQAIDARCAGRQIEVRAIQGGH